MTRVLVTGGAGFIGCHTVLQLLSRGYAVRVLDALTPPVHPTPTRPAWLSREAELHVGDVRDRDILAKALDDVEFVIHLAAYQDYLPDFSTFFSVNTVGTALLYEVIVAAGLPVRKIVVASSQAVYGEGPHLCPEHGVQHPDIRPDTQLVRRQWDLSCPICRSSMRWTPACEATVNPQNQYGLSKYTQELVAFSLGRRYGIPTTCMRYSISQGKWQSPFNSYSGICRIFTLRAQADKPAVVFEDGLQVRDYVHVEDVARANLLVMESPESDFQAFNVGGDRAVSAIEYATAVADIVRPGLVPQVPGYYRFGDTRHIVSDSSRLRALGWTTSKGIRDIIAEYSEWAAEIGHVDTTTDQSLRRMIALGTVRSTADSGLG